jgi:hypothetical protein
VSLSDRKYLIPQNSVKDAEQELSNISLKLEATGNIMPDNIISKEKENYEKKTIRSLPCAVNGVFISRLFRQWS